MTRGRLAAAIAGCGLVLLGGCSGQPAQLAGAPAAAVDDDGAPALDGGSARAAAPRAPVTSPATVTSPTPVPTAGIPTSQVDAFVPTVLVLPSGTEMAVDSAGVDDRGLLQVPGRPDRAGWWTGGALAGDPFGGVVLAGHVDTVAYGIGDMAELWDAAVGQRIELRAPGQKARYMVTWRQSVPKARLSADLEAFRQNVPGRLVLVTCGGDFDSASGHYEENVVVVAEPVEREG